MSKQIALLSTLLLLGTPLLAADKVLPIEPPMVAIPAGEYLMGSERDASTQPVRQLAVKAFRMGKYEVTAAEFQRFVEATRYRVPRMCMQMASKRWFATVPNEYRAGTTLQTMSKFEPAVCIGWDAAQAYVTWLAKETGKKYRLPSEAEWEYASRAGSRHRYFFGNDETQTCRYGNLADRSAEAAVKRDFDGLESKNHVGVMPCDDQAGYASIVGMYEPNAFGLHDTMGNVGEYVEDCGHDDYVGAPKDASAWVAGECKTRTLRGGAWHWRGPHAANRGAVSITHVGGMEGFRVAEDIVATTSTAAKPAPSAFELELAEAQRVERERRAKLPLITAPAP